MTSLQYQQQELHFAQVSLTQIAEQYGTPCYIYSRQALTKNWQAFDQALKGQPHLICYAVKANSNLAVLQLLAGLGSGFDIVSVGELERVLAAGGDPAKVVFSGVGKQTHELERALAVGIRCFNIESAPELERLQQVAARMQRLAPISIRVNPDVDANTHPYISTGLKENKFGVDVSQALNLYQQAAQLSHIQIVGMDCHIGSQLTSLKPFIAALERLLELVKLLQQQGIELQHLDLGGGLGICYQDEQPPAPMELGQAILKYLAGSPYEIILEPGRAIVGDAGILLSRVEYLKTNEQKRFAIIDAAMNDLMRPALYQAWQRVLPVIQRPTEPVLQYDIVGPICETGDFLAKGRELALQAGDLIVIATAGAYGFAMSSNYNSRPRVAEVMVDNNKTYLIRQRENLSDLWRGEILLDH